jgi:hypothetical protein
LPSEWLNYAALAVAAASLAATFLRTARTQGADRQRIAALEARAENLATAESLFAVGARVDDLERAVKEVNRTLNQVGIIATKVDGLDRLVTREMDEIKHTLRKLEERSFAPAPGRRPHEA